MAEPNPPRRSRAAPLSLFLEGPAALALRAALVVGAAVAALAALGLMHP
ncbi:hypothetical protein G3576_21280 [Roseomonas stagni]|uniref:Uncharacterized protein n=1 Tax=Falsiroseomonas algicola TaxID=2716930 RepID=A0A6M1LR48_9PROT|nr:hypothetical protein [Falsiroseomonas algicola]NGM22563.1 hypothetical protein [Falsiroseomonas algicola]